MSPQLPSFLRRRLRLSEARRSLLGGEPEAALQQLSDPCLALSEEAEHLRLRVLDVLCREAGRHHDEGEGEQAKRLLELVAEHDTDRAQVWRRRLYGEEAGRRGSVDDGQSPRAKSGIISALEGLLTDMRDERTRSGVRRKSAPVADASGTFPAAADSADLVGFAAVPPDRRFRLEVDDIGEFLVILKSDVTLGHSRAGLADLPIMADIDPEHVRLIRTESFHAGPGWRIEPMKDQRIAVAGQLLDPGGGALLDGDQVQVAGNLAFVFRRPEAASGSAVLELLHGAECVGARRVLLLSPGEAGRVRMSPNPGRHFQARRLSEEVTIWLDESELIVESCAQLAAAGIEPSIQGPSPLGPGGLRVPCPPDRRIDFTVGRGGAQGPPFGFAIAPVDRSRPEVGQP